MLCSFGFDTLVVSYDRLRYSEFKDLIEHFFKLGIRKYIFIFDYEPNTDSIAILYEYLSRCRL